jgi:integrase/recombinase XerD
MKVNRNGQAKILTPEAERQIFQNPKCNRVWQMVFSICLYTGCRISEALSLQVQDISQTHITFRRENTKGKNKGRQVPLTPLLQVLLGLHLLKCKTWLFPGKVPGKHLTTRGADITLRRICADIGLEGVSTHSFRRTALTRMHKAGVPLKSIQMISGHSNLANLQRYLEVTEDDLIYAVNQIGHNNDSR